MGGSGGGGLSGSNTNSNGPLSSGAITVNAGGGNNTIIYVLLGVLGFVGLVAILMFGRR